MKVGPKFKICRRLGSRVFPKCQTTKFTISGTAGKRGGRASRRPRTLSEYGRQLLEKQKVRYTYGLKEGQLANYVTEVQSRPAGDPPAKLCQLLESRLDNVVFRLGVANSRAAARQLVSHGHILVNSRRVNIPSYLVKVGDRISIRPQSQGAGIFKDLAERLKNYQLPPWLTWDQRLLEGQVAGEPVWGAVEADLNFSSILEFYSRV